MKRIGMAGSVGLFLAFAVSHALAQTGRVSPGTSGTSGTPQFSPRPNAPGRPQAASTPTQTPAPAPPANVQELEPRQSVAPFAPEGRTLLESPREGDPPFYVLHPGDTIDVTFRYTPEFNDEVVIGPDGRASLKSTGDIRMSGRTVPELRRLIVTGSTDKLVNPDVAVSVKDFERPNVVVAGEVTTPGRFELRKPTTVLQAILMAGGPKDDAALGRVVLFRKVDADTAETHVLKLSHYSKTSLAKNDMVLQPGDMILVRHDNLSRIERFVKATNLGVYFNPVGNNGIF